MSIIEKNICIAGKIMSIIVNSKTDALFNRKGNNVLPIHNNKKRGPTQSRTSLYYRLNINR